MLRERLALFAPIDPMAGGMGKGVDFGSCQNSSVLTQGCAILVNLLDMVGKLHAKGQVNNIAIFVVKLDTDGAPLRHELWRRGAP